jgi:hypothetical protein
MLWRSADTGLSSTNRLASSIRGVGRDRQGAGINRKWSGSIRQHRKSNINPLRLSWLPDQQQGRHLSWQSPERVSKYTGRTTGPAPFINYQQEMVDLLQEVEPEVVSLIFLKSLFDTVGAYDQHKIQQIASFIGSRLEDEVRFRYYEGLGCERLTNAAHKRVSCSDSTPPLPP